MKKTIFTALLALVLGGNSATLKAQTDFNVVPRPVSVQQLDAQPFVINADTRIFCGKSKAAKRNAAFLQQFIKERTGLTVSYSPMGKKFLSLHPNQLNGIFLLEDPAASNNAEGYQLTVGSAGITIKGASNAGVFYGIQTLRKALPHRIINPANPRLTDEQRKVEVAAVNVTDYPRFKYRGAHLDVSRHFVTTDSIRRFIDMLALHNINRFHWHLTEDQGWRIEIKKYPRLTSVGSKRSETVIGHNSGVYDGIPYGGYYTQKECKEIVKYAAERNITIIPEIDMPGHMLGALAAYPELGCTGGPYEVWRIWGVSEDVLCAGNDKTLKFIDDVLDEIVKIFPSEYIHVGGDECPKTAWKKCPKCQARIKAEGLEAKDGHTAEERLQSYVIRHAEAHLAKLGRKMIGWDETLEGGLADGATVMSWRGEEGGIEAARQHHDVIMTPNTYLYFDYYQTLNTATEPDAIGGYLPLERVYNYEPVSDTMIKENIDQYIVGVQANCWTEYMPTYRQIEYMEMPRMAALADIQWSPRGTKDYEDFLQRTVRLIGVYDELGYNYAKHIYDVQASYTPDLDNHCIVADLRSTLGVNVHYTLDGSEPTQGSAIAEGPISINESTKLRACTFRPVEARLGSSARRYERSNIEVMDIDFNKATTKKITLAEAPAPRYTFNGGVVLVDGLKARTQSFQSGQWLGFNGKDLVATIDLGSEQEFSSVSINALGSKADWVFDARSLTLEISEDGEHFTKVAAAEYPAMEQTSADGILPHRLDFSKTSSRYVRVTVGCEKSIPQWHNGRGMGGFLFVDEICIE